MVKHVSVSAQVGLNASSFALKRPPVEGWRNTYANADKELVEGDSAVTVGVEETHERVSLSAGHLDLNLAETGVEFLLVDLVVAIEGVEVPESSSEAADGLSTASVDLLLNSLENCIKSQIRRLFCSPQGRDAGPGSRAGAATDVALPGRGHESDREL